MATDVGGPVTGVRTDGDGPDGPDAPVAMPGLGPIGWLRWAWRQLTSMRTALLLLLLLAVAAVPGSVFPQRRIDPGRVIGYLDDHRSVGPWLDRFGFFDVYTSPWFSAIYLLLFVSLVGCVLPRTRLHLRALRQAPPRTPRRLERMPAHTSHVVEGDPAAILERARTVLKGRRYRTTGYDGSVAAERGYLAETGNLVFHLALLGVLAGIAAGSFYSWSGQAVVVEGKKFSNTFPMYDSFDAGRRVDIGALPPFSFTLDSLKVAFEQQAQGSQLGAPRMFDAHLTVKDTPDSAPRDVVVRPNQPLDVQGARAFLVGNGYAPEITVRDGSGNVAQSGPVVALPQDGNYKSVLVVKAPDAKPRQIGVSGMFLPTLDVDPVTGLESIFPDAIDPRVALTVWVSKPGEDGLQVDTGRPQSVFQLDTSKMTQLTRNGEPLRILLSPGQSYTLPDGLGSVSFDGLRRYGAFDLRYDPTKGVVLVFAMLALAGVTASLFVRRRRVWARVSTDGEGRTVVEVAGLARGEDSGLGYEVEAVAAAIAGLPQPARGRRPAPGSPATKE